MTNIFGGKDMKQQIKILIAQDKGVWISFPITQKELDRLTKDKGIPPQEFEIQKVVCNSFRLSEAIFNSRGQPKFLSKMNYLGSMFFDFSADQRTRFGCWADNRFGPENTLDDFIVLAMNVKNKTDFYTLYTVQIPKALEIRIKRDDKNN